MISFHFHKHADTFHASNDNTLSRLNDHILLVTSRCPFDSIDQNSTGLIKVINRNDYFSLSADNSTDIGLLSAVIKITLCYRPCKYDQYNRNDQKQHNLYR